MKDRTYFFLMMRKLFISNSFLFLLLILFSFFTEPGTAQIYTRIESSVISTPQGRTFGAGWIDFNGDGYLDIFANNYDRLNRVYINNQDGTFSMPDNQIVNNIGSYYSGLTWGDYDNNGYNDLFITSLQGKNLLLSNLGNGNFVRINNTPVIEAPASDIHLNCTWVDYDNDSWLDLFIPTVQNFNFAGGTPGLVNYLFHNNGNGTFTKLTDHSLTTEPGNNQSANFADIDNDGDMDAFITEWDKDNWLYENNGDGTFTRITGGDLSANTNTSMASCWGDFNNDGFMDLYVGNGNNSTVTQNNMLYFNNGDKTFTKITTGDAVNTPGCTWTCLTADVDNDGDLDLYMGDLNLPNKIFLNDGTGNFSLANAFDVSCTFTSGAAFADYDNNGFMDLFSANANNGSNTVYHNNGNENNWLIIKCLGSISNKSAIGARVKVKAVISGNPVWQIRDIMGNQGFRSYNDLRAHFGLGDASVADSVVIYWPSGEESILTDINVNNIISVTENIPMDYLRGEFKADTVSGFSPFEVKFSETSLCNESNPVTSWSWDFNNDGIEDSDEKNPEYVFETDTEKYYTVTLIVTNGSKTETIIRENYIHVLPLHMQNIALAKNISASSIRPPDNAPSYAVDGDLNSKWWSQPADSQWLLIELDSIYNVGKITIYWTSSYSKYFIIQSSTDSSSWNDVTVVEGNDGGIDVLNFDPVRAKFFKFLFYLPSGKQGFSIKELEIYRPSSLTYAELKETIPGGFYLCQNYPNPFNPVTNFEFRIADFGFVQLKIYDLLGKEVATLVNEEKPAGTYKVQFNAGNLSSGIYFYKLTAGVFSQTNKFVLLK